MTKTHTTATAAHTAQVSPRTIRRWAAAGKVVAVKTAGHWVIDTASLNTHIAARIAHRADQIITLADFTPFKDKATARDGVMNLLQDGSVIHLTGGLYQVASKTNDNVYLVDTQSQTCDCKGWVRSNEKAQASEEGLIAYCSHLTAANAIEASKSNTRPVLTLIAA